MTSPLSGPLQRKLMALTMACSLVALLTTAGALGAYEFVFFRRTTYAHLETVTDLAARNSAAALMFADTEDARRVLQALGAESVITAAALYDRTGVRLAEYTRPGVRRGLTPLTTPADGRAQRGTELDIAVPVMEGERLGTLLVRADVSAISERLSAYALVLLGTTLGSGLLAFFLSGWLTRRIVAPVRALVETAGKVKTQADYSLRVAKTDDDELGVLADAFNEMLARVQANENQLHRGNERLRLALEAGRIGTWDWNLVRDEVVWSERNYEIFGVPAGTAVDSQLFFSLIHPDERARVKAAVEEAARSAHDFATEFRLARPERPAHYVAARGRFLKSNAGDPLRAVGVSIDVTERRGGELRVIESETRFRAMAERAPALIWSCDERLRRDYFNKTWLAFTGRQFEDEAGDGWQQGLPGTDLRRWREVVGTAAMQLDPYSIEYRLRRHDGLTRWVVETASPRFSADGSFAGYLGTCIDITARKENEAELEAHVSRRTRELEAANRELESFSYSVSHDLRGPVRAIQGFTEIALEDCQTGNPAAAVERLDRVLKAAERMNRLIDAFLGMARISRSELHPVPVDLSRLAEEVSGYLRATHPSRAIEVTIAPGLTAHGDERLLRIALENLLGNAWKFTARTERPRIEVGAEMQGEQRVFFVRDNGAGFDPALAPKLFRPFERLHPNSEFEGLGVGLNTVQRVIHKHEGRVWAEGRPGAGATFYFTLG